MKGSTRYSLAELVSYLEAELKGDPQCEIGGIAGLKEAKPGELSFLANPAYKSMLAGTRASAVIVDQKNADELRNAIIYPNPYLGYARIAKLFEERPTCEPGVHHSAVVDSAAQVDKTASVGPLAVIAKDARIAGNVVIGAGCFIGEKVVIGKDGFLDANVTVQHDVVIGERVVIHSGAVIGADGFGFADNEGRWEKIAQIGGVRIGDDVEIGASTTIDRGALADTLIGDGVKIDNQVMIAHNVKIGDHTAIAGCVGISGSTEIGQHCTLAGGVGLVGHIRIADHVHVTGMTMVTKSIESAGSYSSGTAMMPTNLWKKNTVRIRQLDDLAARIRDLEKQLKEFKGNQV